MSVKFHGKHGEIVTMSQDRRNVKGGGDMSLVFTETPLALGQVWTLRVEGDKVRPLA